jgi:tetratricopeptide (TPR) repeat protein
MVRPKLHTLAACGVLALFAGCSVSPKAKHDRALARAKHLLQEKDYDRALLECRTAIQALPKEADGYYQLGVVYSSSHQLQNAVISFQKALSLKPNYADAQVGLAEIMASSADPTILKEAQSRMTEVLKTNAANVDAIGTLALANLKLGNTSEALGELHQALSVAPKSLKASILLAEAKLSQKDAKGAEDVLKQACEHDPASSEARVALANFYLSQNRTADAEQSLRDAVKVNPANATALLSLGKLQLSRGDKAAAEQSFRSASLLRDRTYASAYGLFLFNQGRKEEGLREFERLTRAAPNDRSVRTMLVAAYWSTDRPQEARKIVDRALEKNSKDIDALVQRAEMYVSAGDYRNAQTDAMTILHLDAASVRAHRLLADAYQGLNQPLQERQELAETLRLAPSLLDARIKMANLLVSTNAASSALKLLDEAPGNQKTLLPIVIARNWALIAAGDMAGARKGIDSALAVWQGPELLLQDGIWKLQQGKTEQGRAALTTLLNSTPDNVAALSALYESYAAQKQAALGTQTVKEYAAKAPRSLATQEYLGRVLKASGDMAGARAAFASVIAADPRLRSSRMALIQIDAQQGKWDAALENIQALLNADKSDSSARLWLANVEEAKGDHAAALVEYQKVVAADDKNPEALNNLAYLLVDYKNQPDAALPFAQKAQQLMPNNPNYADTVGWVFYQKGMYSLAAHNFAAAAANPSASPVCAYHLAMAYAKLGDRDRGKTVLAAALKRDSAVPEAAAAKQLLSE